MQGTKCKMESQRSGVGKSEGSDPYHEKEVVAEFEKRGFVCTRDDAIINLLCGGGYSDEPE